MTDAAAAVRAAIADAHRRSWGRVLATTVRVTRDLDLAEEAVQEAYVSAVAAWQRDGIPENPEGWLTTAARRRAVDAIRRESALRTKLPLLLEPEATDGPDAFVAELAPVADDRAADIPDERLRLIFLCCHPALAQDAQLALTLRLVCGVPTADIARLFLVPEPTMAARMTRAKKKIVTARIPYRVPAAAELPDRLRGVLGVIHLLFTTGHTSPSGASLMRTELADQALALARMLRELMPDEPEVRGLLALILVTDARRSTRVDPDGRLVRLEHQDRSQWDRSALAEAHDLIVDGLRVGGAGRYVLQAAIASLYAEAPTYERTDWPQLVELYDALLVTWPSPVVAVNRAVPLSMVRGPEQALAELEELQQDARLAGYPYLPAIVAELLLRLGRDDEAVVALERARELTANETERTFLSERIAQVRNTARESSR